MNKPALLNYKDSASFLLLIIIGFNNGLIPLLLGSTLFVWLNEYGINLQTIGLYSLSSIPLVFSFVLSITLTKCSTYRYFKFKYIVQFNFILIAILLYILPGTLNYKALLFAICFIVNILTSINVMISQVLQKTIVTHSNIVIGVNMLTVGFKVGILASGSIALYLSQFVEWGILYKTFSFIILAIVVLIHLYPSSLFQSIVPTSTTITSYKNMLLQIYKDLRVKKSIIIILLLMFFYRAPDSLITHYFNLIYLHLGVSKTTVAVGYKFYGLIMSTLGGFFCILLIKRFHYQISLLLTLFLHLLSYMFIYTAISNNFLHSAFYLCVSLEEFTRGLTMIAFWTYQVHLCNKKYLLIQLAVFTGIDSLSNSLLGSVSGSVINHFGYLNFFILVILSFIPAFVLLCFINNSKNKL